MDTYCTDSHEWVRVDGDTIELGLTAHAVQELTDVTFVEIQPQHKGSTDTPYSMNSLLNEFFKEFPGGILGVCETIWGLFGGNIEGNLKENY